MQKPLCQECQEAEQETGLDINLVLKKLATIKGGELSQKDSLYLCLNLCSRPKALIAYRLYNHKLISPDAIEITEDLEKKINYLASEMSTRVHLWIKKAMGLDIDNQYTRLPNWDKIRNFFLENDCKKYDRIDRKSRRDYWIYGNLSSELPKEEIQSVLNDLLRQKGFAGTVNINRMI